MKVDYVDHMGSDLSVVNAARVSFDKTSEWEVEYPLVEAFSGKKEVPRIGEGLVREHKEGEDVQTPEIRLSERDAKLIKYLARHNHWTPFSHTAVSLRIRAPIFVARQLGKHQVGLVWNEVSRRYVDDPPEFYEPEDGWRGKPENSKQGSSEKIYTEFYETFDSVDGERVCEVSDIQIAVDSITTICDELYQDLISSGICPEQARMVLPQSMYTEWIWTGNLMSFANMCKLRLDPHTQKETRDVAQLVNDTIAPLYPISWKELMK